jgi:hypothetical protein
MPVPQQDILTYRFEVPTLPPAASIPIDEDRFGQTYSRWQLLEAPPPQAVTEMDSDSTDPVLEVAP